MVGDTICYLLFAIQLDQTFKILSSRRGPVCFTTLVLSEQGIT